MSFNSKKLGALQPREKRYVLTLDKGLTLRVHPSGKKSFVLRICQNGKIKDVTLGHFPDLSLAQAKALARKKQKQYAIDPVSGYTVSKQLSAKAESFYLSSLQSNSTLDRFTTALGLSADSPIPAGSDLHSSRCAHGDHSADKQNDASSVCPIANTPNTSARYNLYYIAMHRK